ncbi:uncharacterized protein PV07_02146 [Cladophialophora immunda]|uniref:NAD(+) diphosphatase n=1 Tax=Cladophialophora immunda TaxID=569365 RepID=A0A0D2DIA6_9EURO|nr:uncharacterized protein PV07_02146 [Cladophialophora immunda]KIW35449.1 hypothetical protein PV07_02146 [Cladophialophora immunda]OQV02844.1 NADH pyrophosphatase zinc ribbon domain-containing protein [Cladophialophora immunda]
MANAYQTTLDSPAQTKRESFLSVAKFGRERANYFASSPLNRLSFLRDNHEFLTGAFDHASTNFICFRGLAPLHNARGEIHYVTRDTISPIITSNPFETTEEEMVQSFNSSIVAPQLVFLGIDQRNTAGYCFRNFIGAPYFALDLTPKHTYEVAASNLARDLEAQGLSFAEGRPMHYDAESAAIFAQARHYLDWNARNTFCGTCGQKTLSTHGGAKRVCPPTDRAESTSARAACSTRTTISNLSFPRTDPTVIVAVLSFDGQRVLLGHQKRWPSRRFSALAGFIEPAESAEDAARREVWEETGVVLSRVVIFSTQPWPLPANLMVGVIGQARSPEDEIIKLDIDPELEAAEWFRLAEVGEALRAQTEAEGSPSVHDLGGCGLTLPPPTAIAHHLLGAVVDEYFQIDAATWG